MRIDKRSLQRRTRQHVNAQEHRFYAVVQPGFEKTAQNELRGIGIEASSHTNEGGIEFNGRLDDCYRVNLCSRTISRLLMRLTSFKAKSFEKVKKRIQDFPWELYLCDDMPLSFSVSCHRSRLYHTGRLESEIAQRIRNRMESYGNEIVFYRGPDKFTDSQVVFGRFENDICQISLDTSGDLLYRRKYGEDYRGLSFRAPLRETIASLILLESRIFDYDIVMDPMCGSGTFSIESGMIFSNRYPGLNRGFAFERWPSFRRAAYNHQLKKLFEKSISESLIHEKRIICSDINSTAIDTARENIRISGLTDHIEIRKMDFLKETIPLPGDKRTLLVLNPPYGTRLKNSSVERIYRGIGRKIRTDYNNCGYAIIVPGIEIEKALSLTYNRKVLFMNGGIRVSLLIKDIE
jgi:putative N6-adenine-specific DNA methylase